MDAEALGSGIVAYQRQARFAGTTEMAFLGAPECDVSFLKVGDEILQSDIPCPEGALSYDDIYTEYERVSGRTLRHIPYFELFTAFRSAIISILAMKHFPPEVLDRFLPALRRSVALCVERARRMGIAC